MAPAAFAAWQAMEEPHWAMGRHPPIDYQDAALLRRAEEEGRPEELDEVDPELLRMYEKLGIPLKERAILAGVEQREQIAVDAVFDSVSVATTFARRWPNPA
jgi:Fe-S cluster assembly protein SufB